MSIRFSILFQQLSSFILALAIITILFDFLMIFDLRLFVMIRY